LNFSNKPNVSFVIPMYNEERYIENCLLSLVNQSYPNNKYEIMVIDGNSKDKSRKIVENLQKKYNFIKIFTNPKRITPVSFNIGIKQSIGEIVIFGGAHALYDKDYIKECVKLLMTTDADNVGGIQNAVGQEYIGNAIAYAMKSPFGVGNAYYHFTKKERYVDSVWGGAFRKETLKKLGGFNEKYVKMQDYELNYRLRNKDGKILVSPKIKCNYFVRNSLKKFARQYFIYGVWKVKGIVEHPDLLAIRHLVPPSFVVGLLASILIFPFNLNIGLIIPLSYLSLNLMFSLAISIKKGLKYLIILPITFFLMNFSWGLGFLFGLKEHGIPKINIRTILNSMNNN
jgi:succinoglycan biosynthesis protein ExoA